MLTFVVIGDVVVCRICELLSMSTLSSTSLLDEYIVLFSVWVERIWKKRVSCEEILFYRFLSFVSSFMSSNAWRYAFSGAHGPSVLASTLSFSFGFPSIPKLSRANLGPFPLLFRQTNTVINKRKLCKNRPMSYCRLTGSSRRIRITSRQACSVRDLLIRKKVCYRNMTSTVSGMLGRLMEEKRHETSMTMVRLKCLL